MKTEFPDKKYKIVDTEDRSPTNFDQYYTNQGLIDFNPKDGNFWDNTDTFELYPNWWLEEVPDYEEEMIKMLEKVLYDLENVHGSWITPDSHVDLENLLTKLKQQS
ncbi:hypothetical protein [Chryseobacterium sp. M5A1_1a]